MARNIIFVMLDTVRSDCLRAYGSKRGLPVVDSIAERGTTYSNAIASGTYTPTSHSAIFLNKRVMDYKPLRIKSVKAKTSLVSRFKFIPNRNEPTLARKLKYAFGYNTALISNNPFLSLETGVAQGFGNVDNIFIDKNLVNVEPWIKIFIRMAESSEIKAHLMTLSYNMLRYMPQRIREHIYLKGREYMSVRMAKQLEDMELDKGAREANRIAEGFAEESSQKDNFLFINYMEGHEGYPIENEQIKQDKWLYMSGIKPLHHMKEIREAYSKRVIYADRMVGDLVAKLRRQGLLDDAYLIITSDHGQAFMERGQMYHTVFPYKEITDVPLITARFENGRQLSDRKIVEERVSIQSLHNAVLACANGRELEVKPSRVAYSDHTGHIDLYDLQLLRDLRRHSEYAKSIYETKQRFNQFASAVYYGRYKLVHFHGSKRDELYDTERDSAENENIIKQHIPMYNKMLAMA